MPCFLQFQHQCQRVTVNKFREQLFSHYLATLIIFDLPMHATIDFNNTNLSVVDVHTQEF
jgi:hypothetical protein